MTGLRSYWLTLPSLLRWTLIAMFYLALIVGYMIWQHQRPGGASLYGHNHTDRPIFSYWVNDNWGGNAGANGGGKVTCCWRINGDTLKVTWIVSRTRDQIDQGVEREQHEREIPNPSRMRNDRYLHVHFFPGDQVRVAWSPDHDTPYEHFKQAPAEEVMR